MSCAGKYVGLLNQGNTCYLNSVIQMLYHLPYFRRTIFELKPKETSPVLVALRNLFAELSAGNRSITTTELTRAFNWTRAEVDMQHDVHEFVQQLFDALETIVKGTPEEAFIRDLFGGLLIYRSVATDGVEYVSDRLETFYDVELVVEKKGSLEESLQALTAPERIEGVSIEVTKGAAPSKHDIERSLHLLKLPPVLLVHPNRVGFDMETFEPITLDNRWSFTADLNLAAYMADPNSLRLDAESTEKQKKLLTASSKSSASNMPVDSRYTLRAVLVHAGDATVGHHYVYVRFPKDEWVCFNDESVDAASATEVSQAAFGGVPDRGYNSRRHLFGSERAALLVYVNTACAESILTELPPSEEILAMARHAAEARSERWNTTTVTFFVGDESYVDVLDGVPGAEERLAKSVKVSASASDLDLRAAVARALGVASAHNVLLGLRIVRYQYNRRYYLAEVCPDGVEEEEEDDDDDELGPNVRESRLFGFLRACERPGEIGTPHVFHSFAGLRRLIGASGRLFSYSAATQSLTRISDLDEMGWGGNFIWVKEGVEPGTITACLRKRQLKKTEVVFIDRMNTASMHRRFSLTVADDTTYTALQGGVFDFCKQLPAHFKSLPRSSKYIGFYFSDTANKKPMQHLAPLFYRSRTDGSEKEVTLEMLCGNVKERKLYVTFLPIPMVDVNNRASVLFRIGWAQMPMVYFTREQRQLSFAELLQVAFLQLGERIPEKLRERHRDMQASPQCTTCPMARLLQVEDGIIVNSTQMLSTPVNLTECDGDLVVDPLFVEMPGFSAVNVCFCSRRRGEDYFGYPTNAVVSADMTETGLMLKMRVAKKLNVPQADEATKKWMLYVKKLHSKNVKLCDVKSVLADVVKAIGGGPFELLIDRPMVPELDGLIAMETKPDENGGIVIKSSSTADLSAL